MTANPSSENQIAAAARKAERRAESEKRQQTLL